jgi:hypothetical protein
MLRVPDLERALRGLRPLRPAEPRGIDWEAMERLLGADLPPDYKEFAEAYPALELDGFLRVRSPDPGMEQEFVADVMYELEILTDLQDSEAPAGHVPYPEPGGLLPWGGSVEGDVFYWRTVVGAAPEHWPVVASGRNGSWWECEDGVLAFLVGVVSGTGGRGELPDGILGPDAAVELLDNQ